MFGIGYQELMVLGIIALLLFGKRLPEVARGLGKSLTEFKKGMAGIETEIHDTVNRPVSTTSSYSRPTPSEERDEAVAPKFEPPKFEPGEPSVS